MEITLNPNAIELPIFGGIRISETFVVTGAATLLLIIAAVLLRTLVIARFKDQPGPLQNALELIVESMQKFANATMGERLGADMAGYIFTTGVFIISMGMVELLSLRSPVTDLNVTAALGLTTFALINVMAIRYLGFKARLGHYAKPYWFIAPFKIVSDMALPISLSCRMYGNILGGMIVMHLLYGMLIGLVRKYFFTILPIALASTVPAMLAIYFNVFHVCMQAYVFMMLSMTFMREGTE